MTGLEAFFGFLGAVVIVAVVFGGAVWIATLMPGAWPVAVLSVGTLFTILALGFYFLWLSDL